MGLSVELRAHVLNDVVSFAKTEADKRYLNLSARRGRSEIYRLTDDGRGKRVCLDVSTMVEWSKERLQLTRFPVDYDRMNNLISSEALDVDRIENYTLQTVPEPILVCRNFCADRSDQIVDGAHRFVVFCTIAQSIGIPQHSPEFTIPGYLFQTSQWKKFVISNDLVDRVDHWEAEIRNSIAL